MLMGGAKKVVADLSRLLIDYSVLTNGAAPFLSGASWSVVSGNLVNMVTGTELLTNGGFDTDTTGWSPSNCTIASVAGGVTGNCCEMTRTAGSTQYMDCINIPTNVGDWLISSWNFKSGTSGDEKSELLLRTYSDGTTLNDMTGKTNSSASSWQKNSTNGISAGTAHQVRMFKKSATAGTMLIDGVSLFRINLPSAISTKKFSSQYGIVKTFMTRELTNARQEPMGCVMCDDGTGLNCVIGYKDNINNTIGMVEILNGIPTVLIAQTSTVANLWDCPIEIRRAQGSNVFQLFFNDAQVGTDQTINNAAIINNKYHGVFDLSFQQNKTSMFFYSTPGTAKRISVFGDSIDADTPGSSVNTWVRYLSECYKAGNNVFMDHAAASATIKTNGGNDLTTQVAAASGDNADLIIIKMGTNDANADDQNAKTTIINNAIDALRSTSPNATIIYVNFPPTWSGGVPVDKSTVRATIAAACAGKGILCIDTFTNPVYANADTADGIHPNASGKRKLFNRVRQYIS